MALIRAEKWDSEHAGESWLEKLRFMNPSSELGCENTEVGTGVESS